MTFEKIDVCPFCFARYTIGPVSGRCYKCDKFIEPVPATPAPSQPAGAREQSAKVITMPPSTYTAKLFVAGIFQVAGTLDGFIDLATPNGTYPLTPSEAKELSAALSSAAADVEANCRYEKDALLMTREEEHERHGSAAGITDTP